ncbi:MAG: response regulator transcription factor [Chloroflexota bacterium]
MDAAVRVLLVEDHPVVIEGLRISLERAGLDVVGAALTTAAGLELARLHQPQVAVLDFNLPDGTGAELAAQLREASPATAVIFVTGDDSDSALLAALEAGARGYVLKSQPPSEVADAVRQAARGVSVMPPGRVVAAQGRAREIQRTQQEADRTRLAPRELEALTLAAQGLATKQIATKLGVSLATGRWYVQQAIEKLGTHSKLEAVAKARRLGLLK